MIVRGGNAMIGKRPLIIKKWDDNFDFKKDIVRAIHVWIRMLKLHTKF